MKEIKSLRKGTNIHEIEAILADSKEEHDINLWLPRNSKSIIFKNTWLFILVTTIGRNSNLTITDYSKDKSVIDKAGSFNKIISTPYGIAAFYHANKVQNLDESELIMSKEGLINCLTTPYIKNKYTSGARVECYSVDPDIPDPPQFDRTLRENRKYVFSSWVKTLTDYIGDKFNIPFGRKREEEEFCSIIFEVFDNSKKHGRLTIDTDSSGAHKIIPGPRYFSISKHIFTSKDTLSSHSASFKELDAYIKQQKIRSRTRRYLEISISDAGEGIAGWYSGVSNEPKSNFSDSEIINDIAKNNKTTDYEEDSDAGQGLEHIVNAVANLNGFLSIRCNSAWIYFCKNHDDDTHTSFKPSDHICGEKLELVPVNCENDLTSIIGTHVSVLIPIQE